MSIENLLNLAENALSSGNYKEAENYSNRILEIDSNHCYTEMRLEIKGRVCGRIRCVYVWS